LAIRVTGTLEDWCRIWIKDTGVTLATDESVKTAVGGSVNAPTR